MEIVRASTQTSSQQGVTTTAAPTSPSSGASDFNLFLNSVLKADSAGKVNEEELFSAIVQERVKKAKGEDGLNKFLEAFTQQQESLKKPDGFVPVEDATKRALVACRDSGLLSAEETASIYSQSFAAAQLDDNKEALFDSKGGAHDASVSVALLEQALLSSRVSIEKFDAGTETASARSVEEACAGKVGSPSLHTSEESAGFLYKPTSDSNGNLVVLLPSKLSGLIAGLALYDSAGELLESGRYSGNGNGGRDHYRFSKPGGDYPDGLTVEVTLSTQEKIRYVIHESSARFENLQSSEGTPSTSGTNSPPSGGGATSPDDSPESL